MTPHQKINFDELREKFNAHKFSSIITLASLIACIYWGVIASDRYVSEAHVIMINTQMSGSSNSSAMLGGISTNAGSAEFIATQMWLRDYLLSIDMMELLDAKLNLRDTKQLIEKLSLLKL